MGSDIRPQGRCLLLCPGMYTEQVLPTSTPALPCSLPVAFACWETWAVIKKKDWMPFSQVGHQSNQIIHEMIGILSGLFLLFPQSWRGAQSLCSFRERSTEKMLTSRFPSQSSAASGHSQMLHGSLGRCLKMS